MCENIQLVFALLRIGIYSMFSKQKFSDEKQDSYTPSNIQFFRRLCGRGPPPVRPNFTVLCLGLGRSGKSSLLAKVSGETTDEIEPTVGFSIKALMFDNCFMDVKELGGGDNVRPYWNRYFTGAQGIIFVVDSSSDEKTLRLAKEEFEKTLSDNQLYGLPLLLLANYQDVPGARSEREIRETFELEKLTRQWIIQACTVSDRDSILKGFQKLSNILISPRARDGDFDAIE